MEVQNEQDHASEGKKENIVDPSIQCLFSRKPCKRKRLKGFDFCHKHILEDKNSPFQQCSFIIKSTEERCTNPAPKALNKKTFCLIHTRDPKLKKAHDEIMRRNLKRKLANRKAAIEQKKGSTEASTSTQRAPSEPKRQREEETEPTSAPETDGIYRLQDNGGKRSEVAWFGENESDADSVDSEEEDPLRHAGVWTVEEALKICRDKMIRKRSLYLEQYKRLNLLLKERKRKHLLRMAVLYQSDLPETGGGDNADDDGLSAAESRALGLYQHINGTEVLLEKQAREKRARGLGTKVTPQNRCHHHLAESQKCPNKVLPFTKYCLEHICSDPDQKLFKPCTFEAPGTNLRCDSPVGQIFRGTTCRLHALPLPRFPSEGMEHLMHPESSNQKSEIASDAEGSNTNDVDMKSAEEDPEETTAGSNISVQGNADSKENESKLGLTEKQQTSEVGLGITNDTQAVKSDASKQLDEIESGAGDETSKEIDSSQIVVKKDVKAQMKEELVGGNGIGNSLMQTSISSEAAKRNASIDKPGAVDEISNESDSNQIESKIDTIEKEVGDNLVKENKGHVTSEVDADKVRTDGERKMSHKTSISNFPSTSKETEINIQKDEAGVFGKREDKEIVDEICQTKHESCDYDAGKTEAKNEDLASEKSEIKSSLAKHGSMENEDVEMKESVPDRTQQGSTNSN